MQPSHSSDPISSIMRGVAGIPGSSNVSVTARRLPRFLPAEPGTGYLEQTLTFAVGAVPEQVGIPADADEVTLTLVGALPTDRQTKADLLVALRDMFESIGVADEWMATAHMDRPAGRGDSAARVAYEVLISRNAYARPGTATDFIC